MPIEPRYAYDRPTMRSSYEASYRMRTPRRPQLIDCRSASPSPLQKGPGPAHQSIKEGENREHGMNGAKWYPPVPKWSHGRMPLREITTEGPRVAGNRKQDAHNRSGVSGNHHDNNKEVNPSFRSNTGVPIKGAATTDFVKGTLPKNFAQPLTCFYWHNNGYCTKSDNECIYAHFYTGVVASAPVSFGGAKVVSIAGRNALSQVQQQNEREQRLDDKQGSLNGRETELNDKQSRLNGREAELNDKQSRLNGREAELNVELVKLHLREMELDDKMAKFDKMDAIVQDIRKALSEVKRSADNACSVLNKGGDEVAALTVEAEEAASVRSAFHAAIEASTCVCSQLEILMLLEVMGKTDGQVG